jgi:valyl-tRNA synthetase
LEYIQEKPEGALSYRVKSNEYFIPIAESINIEDEIEKLKNELNYTEGFLRSVQKKLTNERFVNNAPEQVINVERNKESDAVAKITMLKESLKSLQG